MKKVFFIMAIIIANGVFTSCTELDENLDNETVKVETSLTDGEDQQDPDEDDDDDEGNPVDPT